MIGPDSPVETVLGNADKAKRDLVVDKLGLRTVGDLVHHLPRRYLRTAELTLVEDVEEGQVLVVVGRVVATRVIPYEDRRTGKPAFRVEVTVETDGPPLRMTFFSKRKGVAQWHAERLEVGRRGIFQGKATIFNRQWQLTNPQMVLFSEEEGRDLERKRQEGRQPLELEALRALYPLYPAIKGVDSWDLQRAITFALSVLDDPPDALPEPLRAEHGVLDRATALRWIHLPDDWGQVTRAQHRLRFEEALVTQLVLGRRRRALQAQGAQVRAGGGGLLAAFDARLPFTLTEGQRAVGAEVEADLARPVPMHRLLQGEVGSGKTLVALRAMLRVVDSGGQAALLAPTEVLAQQHHRSITALLGDLAGGGMLGGAAEATGVELLTGSMTKRQRTAPLSRLASGESGIVIGTHALLEDTVQLADLGLVVVDEQHRFGVEQRAALTDKAGSPPHVLVMTATPIPRTVAMTVFGDLEVSTLAELPAGRAAIQTTVVPVAEAPHWVDRVWQRVREEVAAGHQVYVVCPRISGDVVEQGGHDAVDLDEDGQPLARPPSLSAVEEVLAELRAGPLADVRVEPLHGRMTPEDKDRTMTAFAAGEVDVLVATTVIEVGVDVANATTMVLLDADRFGVSQLHQLRGRVGRGGLPGLCLLVTHTLPGPARERLDAVAATTDGFELSQVDLETRREGDVLGRSQSGGRSSLETLRVLRDEETIVAARAAAGSLLDDDPDLDGVPQVAAAVRALEDSVRADWMERS
ncbi:ATP-dependent DNA helicase RecG [Nocardioides kribbensis]|uniref:ATP-dependent DNA helicase RecG n=1 Tax=Nocardioides kribbensis TaxID=305517 RepID=UPI0032D9BD9E